MLLIPMLASSSQLKKDSKDAFLHVRRDMVRHPRYFGLSFAGMLEKALGGYDGSGRIQLSRLEDLTEASKGPLPDVCETLVYAKDDFTPPAGTIFQKEIYCAQNASIIACPEVRAIYAKGGLTIGAGTMIYRWLDAEGDVIVYDHCEGGMSISSASRVIIGRDCSFRRIYAPIVYLGFDLYKGETPQETESAANRQVFAEPVLRDVRYVDDELAQDHVITGTIITKYALTVVEGIEIRGDIRSHESVTLHANTVVHGNIIAEGDIYIGENAQVLGDVFSQENIILEAGVTLGQYGDIKSTIARGGITAEANCRVHGYISAEHQGLCCPDPEKYLDYEEAKTRESSVMPVNVPRPTVLPVAEVAKFASAEEFDLMSAQVFRKNSHLKEAEIPEGVTTIRASFFFACTELRRVHLPSTLREIDDFAFFGCSSLIEANISQLPHLERIGRSAFEGCATLAGGVFPEMLRVVDEAAFYGCAAFERIAFPQRSQLTTIGSHAFFDCVGVTSVTLPRYLTDVGGSAFFGCSGVRRLTIPPLVLHIGSFAFSGCTALETLEITSPELEEEINILAGIPATLKIIAHSEQVRSVLLGGVAHDDAEGTQAES
jgi:cytoskeletal protein CcmA (bactofilin family)